MAEYERIVEIINNLQKTHEQLREFINQLTEENNKLKSQIIKSVEEIEDLDNAKYGFEAYYQCKAEVLEILKRNIGE